MKRQEIHRMIFWWGCISLAFFIPLFPRILPLIISIMVLNWMLTGRFAERFREAFREWDRKFTLMLSIFYLLYVAGLLYTENFDYAFFDLEVKLSFLIFPIIFSTADRSFFQKTYLQKVLTAFILGCAFTTLVLFSHAFINIYILKIPYTFFYSNLGWYFHPGYVSMYFVFAMAILIRYILGNYQRIRMVHSIIIILLIVLFEVFVFLLSSKAGILSMIFVFAFLIIARTLNTRQFIQGMFLLILAFLLIWGTSRIFPKGMDRLKSAEQFASHDKPMQSNESTSMRIAVWKSAYEIIGDHYWFGVGTGDVKDELLKRYKINNDPDALKNRLNAHSQFLQTFITIGVPGILFLLAMFLIPGWISLRKGDHIYFVFLALIGFNILVESMFETQAGVIFYAFFNTMLLRVLLRDRLNIKTKINSSPLAA